MIYVFDSNSLIDLFRHYYPSRFPSLWEKFDALVLSGKITSVREVANEITQRDDRLSDWIKSNKTIFPISSPDELRIVADIFRNNHFQAIIRKKERLQGKAVADPFVIAKAKIVEDGCVVTQETFKENAAKIPNICVAFNIPYLTLKVSWKKKDGNFKFIPVIKLQLQDSLHKKIEDISKEEGISINQFITSALAEKISAFATFEHFEMLS